MAFKTSKFGLENIMVLVNEIYRGNYSVMNSISSLNLRSNFPNNRKPCDKLTGEIPPPLHNILTVNRNKNQNFFAIRPIK